MHKLSVTYKTYKLQTKTFYFQLFVQLPNYTSIYYISIYNLSLSLIYTHIHIYRTVLIGHYRYYSCSHRVSLRRHCECGAMRPRY